MNIEHMLVLSTAHLTNVVARTLDMICDPELMNTTAEWPMRHLVIYPKGAACEFGWIIYILDDTNVEEMPVSLRDCVKLAKANNCRWLMFDRDEDTIDELQTYDW